MLRELFLPKFKSLYHLIKVLCLSKGIELDTGKRVSQIIQALPGFSNIAVLSGPNIANEIAIGKPALSTVSSHILR